ncbi:MAG: DNA mismatch repair endonuclease MutL [Alphaproteobacteria bacterium]|nr:DNA mismatch repair endonuclease MutL [Alphaproteobacteria bacterium]
MTDMPSIRALPDLIIRQIAAGEVIERPASAMKELLENALDSGAQQIDIYLEQAGKRLLQVRDDGHGIAAEELPLAIAKHATSKLANNDLSDINSYGFRGEALASIAAVAKLHIQSRRSGDDSAHEISTENGAIGAVRPARGELGTTITVRDLFHATPARLKFLRSDNAEMAAILENLRHIALCAPAVRFRLYDGAKLRVQFEAVGGLHDKSDDLLSAMMPRLAEIFDTEFVANAYTITQERPPYYLSGLISPAAMHRGRVDRQFLAVNGRIIRDRTLMGVIRAAYGDLMPKGRYPQFALFIVCDPAWLDVNVHPAKTEVCFRDPAVLRSMLINAIRANLDTRAMLTAPTIASTFSHSAPNNSPSRANSAQLRASGVMQQPGFAQDWQPLARKEVPQAGVPDSGVEAQSAIDYPLGAAKAHILGNYIVAENADGMVLIDQHAAHERIVYEKLKADYHDSAKTAVQPLLVPEVLRISADNLPKLEDHQNLLNELGFSFEVFGHDAVVLRAVPALLAESNKVDLLEDILESISEGTEEQGLKDRIYAILSRTACHSSVRAGRCLKVEEMNALLRQIEVTPNGGHCNHGRPTQIFLSLADVKKLFGRKS